MVEDDETIVVFRSPQVKDEGRKSSPKRRAIIIQGKCPWSIRNINHERLAGV